MQKKEQLSKELIRSPKSSDEERDAAQIKFQKLPRNASPMRDAKKMCK